MTDKFWRQATLARLAEIFASSDAIRAARAAQEISDKRLRAELLAKIAEQHA